MQQYCPEHLRMATAKMKYDKDIEEEGIKKASTERLHVGSKYVPKALLQLGPTFP